MPHHRHAVNHPASSVSVFVSAHLADAQYVSARSGVPVSVILAQSGFESGWGRHVVSNAYFGIKGRAPDGATTRFVTHEVSGGVASQITDSFRSYTSYLSSAQDYADLLRRRYATAFCQRDSLNFVKHLHGYATNPLYVATLQSIIRKNNLQRFD